MLLTLTSWRALGVAWWEPLPDTLWQGRIYGLVGLKSGTGKGSVLVAKFSGSFSLSPFVRKLSEGAGLFEPPNLPLGRLACALEAYCCCI